jgi:hypothetical protein
VIIVLIELRTNDFATLDKFMESQQDAIDLYTALPNLNLVESLYSNNNFVQEIPYDVVFMKSTLRILEPSK